MRNKARQSLAVLVLILIFGSSARAADVGRVSGVIRDKATGLSIPGVEILLVYLNQNTEQRKITNDRGEYQFDQVYPPGRYKILAIRKGYRTTEFRGLEVAINTTTRPEPAILLESDVFSSSPVTIEGRTAVVDSADSAPKIVFEPQSLQSLPLSGIRSFDQLALLAPGVTDVPAAAGAGPGVGPGVGTAGQFSVNGQRGRNNNFLVDLSDNNDQDVGVRRQGYVSLVPQSVESIQNFQLIAGSYKAEFGRNSGSIVNAISRSGGNEIHGTVYGYFTDDILSARNFFDQMNGPAAGKSPFQRGQFGFVAGGPFVKDMTFWFAALERQRGTARPEKHFAVPTLAERGFFGHSPLVYSAGNGTDLQGGKLDDLSQFFLNDRVALFGLAGRGVWSLIPMPNNPEGPYGINTYTEGMNADGAGILLSFKLDQQLSKAGTFSARYNMTQDSSIVPVTGGGIHSSINPDVHTRNLTLFLNSNLTNRTSNQARFSYGRTLLNFREVAGSPLLFGSTDQQEQAKYLAPGPILEQVQRSRIQTDFGSYGPFGTTGALGQIRVRPFSPVGVDSFNFPQKRANNTFQCADTFVLQKGPHTLRPTVDVRRVQQNSRLDHLVRPLADFGGAIGTEITPLNGVVRGTDLASIGYATGFFQVLVPDFDNDRQADFDTSVGLRLTEVGLSFEDEWKVSEALNLTLGLRYEMSSTPHEVNRKIESTFADVLSGIPGSTAPPELIGYEKAFNEIAFGLSSATAGRSSIYDPDRDNFAPRIGFAWDPAGTGKTAIRGGFGIFYDQIITSVTSQSRNVFPHLIPLNSGGLGLSLQGLVLTNPQFLTVKAKNSEVPIIAPGTLNTMYTDGGWFRSVLGLLKEKYGQGVAFTLPARRLAVPYGEQYHITVEHEIFSDILVSAAYFGSRGIHLTRSRSPNGGILGRPSFDCPKSSGFPGFCDLTARTETPQRSDPRLGAYTTIENSASSTFHSFQVWTRGRLRQRFQFTGSYQWSHAIDDVSDVFDGLGFFAQPQSDADLRNERASANFDVRHRVTASFVWELPWVNSHRWLGGWTLSGILMARTGQPFTINTSFDVNNDGSLSDRLNSTLGIQRTDLGAVQYTVLPGVIRERSSLLLLAEPGHAGLVGRNTFVARGISTLDLSAFRSFSLDSRRKLEVRCEAFNIFNRTHFGVPIRILEAPGFGRSVDTTVGPRLLQLAVKLHF
jgi:hypothetical protein